MFVPKQYYHTLLYGGLYKKESVELISVYLQEGCGKT